MVERTSTKTPSITCNHAFSIENLHTSPFWYFLCLRMDPSLPAPTGGSTVSASTSSSPASPPVLFLEVSLISAQDLTPVSKSTRTYAVAWISPTRKLATRSDHHRINPTWNEKLTFRVDSQFLLSANAVLNVDIYTITWFRHILVGTVRVLLRDILGPPQKNPMTTRFVALQVRRPNGDPQGILNMGVALLDNSLKSMLLQHQEQPSNLENQEEDHNDELVEKIQLWRSMSVGSEMTNSDQFPQKEGSVCNGSVVNGSEICSDIGPSASIVAADIAMKMQPPLPVAMKRTTPDDETGSSVLEELTFEEAIAKGYKNKTSRASLKKASYKYDESEVSYMSSRHTRRNSDGSLFSCFVGGVEFTIVCGSGNKPNSNKYSNSMSRRKYKPSDLSSE